MGALLSQLEEQNDKFEKRLWTIERQVAFLNKMYAEMDKRKADSDAESKQASPLSLHMPFLELSERYGYIAQNGGDAEWVIPVDIVKGWLSSVGIGGLI
jgi:hypothetical protein